jgi:hypoxanthine phosphoribosyltransferase
MTGGPKVGGGAVQISAEAIALRVREVARAIEDDYRNTRLHLICVLTGAFAFFADLARQLDLAITVDFLAVTSYGSQLRSSGEVRLTKDLSLPIAGRDVLVIEDIIDSGLTMQYLLRYLSGRGPASLEVATLLDKPSRRAVEIPLRYVGFTIPDAFVYGYGLDHDQFGRNLPFITSLGEAELASL